MVDPLPGPRSAEDFIGLQELVPFVHQVTGETTMRPPAGSSLPRLARELPARIVLLDPTDGAEGMAQQIAAAAQLVGAGRIMAVDVGGDALTDGTEPGLRSPLADQLALAACLRTHLPTTLLVVAAGLDGELSERDPHCSLREVRQPFSFGSVAAEDVAGVDSVLRWHPTEASGLLAAAALGLRGKVEVRDAGDQVELTDATPVIHAVDLAMAASALPARELVDTTSLEQAEKRLFDLTGLSELQYETEKADRLSRSRCARADRRRLAGGRRAGARGGRARRRLRQHASTRRTPRVDEPRRVRRAFAVALHERPDQYAVGAYRVRF